MSHNTYSAASHPVSVLGAGLPGGASAVAYRWGAA